jgi:hypothetical protein
VCFFSSPTHPATRAHTCAYVTRSNVNVSRSFEPRHVIPDTRFSSGQCPRCDVTISRCGVRHFQSPRNRRRLRHIHVNSDSNVCWVRKCTAESTDGSQEFFASSLEWTSIGSQYPTDNIVFLNSLGEKSDKIKDVTSSSLRSAPSLT